MKRYLGLAPAALCVLVGLAAAAQLPEQPADKGKRHGEYRLADLTQTSLVPGPQTMIGPAAQSEPPKATTTVERNCDSLLGNLLLAAAAIYGLTFTMLGVIVQVSIQKSAPALLTSRSIPVSIFLSVCGMWLQGLAAAPFASSNVWWGYGAFTLNLGIIAALSSFWILMLNPDEEVELLTDGFFDD